MLNKSTTLLVIFTLLGSHGLAFVHVDGCDMPCCQVEMTCCSTENRVEDKDCDSSMITCDTALLFPIAVAPINIVEQRVEDQIVALFSIPITLVLEQIAYTISTQATPIHEPPPSHQTPLLI